MERLFHIQVRRNNQRFNIHIPLCSSCIALSDDMLLYIEIFSFWSKTMDYSQAF